MATNNYFQYVTTATTTATAWGYSGSGSYQEHDGCIKVDKGAPDKAQFVIFYAILEKGDPMIFCKTQIELDKEMKKLLKREDVDKKSIRVFSLIGGIKSL